MKLFAIHAPLGLEAVAALEGARAARTGFSLSALIFGPLWLLARGLWRELIVYALAAAAVAALAWAGGLGAGAAALLCALGQLYLAFEGRNLAVAARERAGRPTVDVVYARSALEAEKAYFERALRPPSGFAPRGAPPSAPDVIGLFPEPGR